MSKKGPPSGLPSGPAVLLGCYSNFTFLTGASHPAEMVEAAAALGWQAVGIADVNSLAGIVRAHVAARDAGIGLVVGARLRPVDGPDIIAHPTDRAGYEALSVLLSEANMRGSKGAPVLYLADLARVTSGTRLLVMPPSHPDAAHATQLGRIREIVTASVFVGAALYRDGGDEARLAI
ncbi:MAG: PHP domain-containing protein, partial [Novosphingobium sp.]